MFVAGHRAIEEGTSAMGSQISVEEHTVCVRKVFHTLVLTIHSTVAQNKIRELLIQCLAMVFIMV